MVNLRPVVLSLSIVAGSFPVILLFLSFKSFAQVTRPLDPLKKPLWEAGVGVGSAQFPHYPGSNEIQHLTLPIPLFIYRGAFLRSDQENGLRGRFFEDDRFEFSFSFGGSLPAPSSRTKARRGMKDLDPLAEFGPSLRYKIKEVEPGKPYRISLNLPLRFASSIDFPNFTDQGLVFNPSIYFVHQGFLLPNLILFLGSNVRFTTEKYGRYFYSVDSASVTSERAEYTGRGGYAGSGASLALSYLFPKNFSLFSALAVTNYSGSVNRHSPLMTAENTMTLVVGFTWWFYESERLEDSLDPSSVSAM